MPYSPEQYAGRQFGGRRSRPANYNVDPLAYRPAAMPRGGAQANMYQPPQRQAPPDYQPPVSQTQGRTPGTSRAQRYGAYPNAQPARRLPPQAQQPYQGSGNVPPQARQAGDYYGEAGPPAYPSSTYGGTGNKPPAPPAGGTPPPSQGAVAPPPVQTGYSATNLPAIRTDALDPNAAIWNSARSQTITNPQYNTGIQTSYDEAMRRWEAAGRQGPAPDKPGQFLTNFDEILSYGLRGKETPKPAYSGLAFAPGTELYDASGKKVGVQPGDINATRRGLEAELAAGGPKSFARSEADRTGKRVTDFDPNATDKVWDPTVRAYRDYSVPRKPGEPAPIIPNSAPAIPTYAPPPAAPAPTAAPPIEGGYPAWEEPYYPPRREMPLLQQYGPNTYPERLGWQNQPRGWRDGGRYGVGLGPGPYTTGIFQAQMTPEERATAMDRYRAIEQYNANPANWQQTQGNVLPAPGPYTTGASGSFNQGPWVTGNRRFGNRDEVYY